MFKRGTWFPWMLVAILVISVGGNIYMVMRAANDPAFAVEPNYYQKAVDWDRLQAEQAASDALGWKVVVDARPTEVRIRLSDRLGGLIDGATVRIEAFANARAQNRLTGYMIPKGQGVYVFEDDFKPAGVWEYRLVAEVGDKRFLHATKEVLP